MVECLSSVLQALFQSPVQKEEKEEEWGRRERRKKKQKTIIKGSSGKYDIIAKNWRALLITSGVWPSKLERMLNKHKENKF